MHDEVHWRAVHPLDLRHDEWLQDVSKYFLTCNIGSYNIPSDDDGKRIFARDVRNIDSRDACDVFGGY